MFSLFNRITFAILAIISAALIGYFIEKAVYVVLAAIALYLIQGTVANVVSYLRLKKKRGRYETEEQYKSWLEYAAWRRGLVIRDVKSDFQTMAFLTTLAASIFLATQFGWSTAVAAIVTIFVIGSVAWGLIGAIALAEILVKGLFLPLMISFFGGWLGIPAEEQARMYQAGLRTKL
ncbi:MAG: hypothetical protein HYW37_00265 [Candidatus Colwellbacteria bacterium]|nr:hypothetical protein [Candidatus Colwellbacteria bacterium]